MNFSTLIGPGAEFVVAGRRDSEPAILDTTHGIHVRQRFHPHNVGGPPRDANRGELDEANDLLRRVDEYVEDHNGTLERWREAFSMELTDDGWTWQPFLDDHNRLVDRYDELVKLWNRVIPLVNVQDVGRPLAASETQITAVLRLHKAGKSLRGIADETSLGLQTVRTIIDRRRGADRATKKRREKIEINKFERARWKSQRRTADALPKQVQAVIETGNALVTEAKGLGRGR